MSMAIVGSTVGALGTAYSAYENKRAGDAQGNISNYQSPQSQIFWNQLGRPVTMDVANTFQRTPRGPNGMWEIPALPEPYKPDAPTYMSDTPMYDIPEMPTYNNMSSEMRSAVEQPFQRGSELLAEQLGGMGQMGSAGAGASGAGADVLRNYWTEAAPQMQQSAMAYGLPIWQQQIAQNAQQRQEQMDQGRMAYEQEQQYNYQMQEGNPMQMYNMNLQQSSLPWTSTLGILPQYAQGSQPVISPPSGGSMFSGAYGPMMAQGVGDLMGAFNQRPATNNLTARTQNPSMGQQSGTAGMGYPTY